MDSVSDGTTIIDEIFGAHSQSDLVVPKPEGANGVMMVAFHDDVGAVYFSDDDGQWVSRNAAPMPQPPFVMVDSHVPYFFPPESVLPLADVRAVVSEYVRTGRRPVCVGWISVNWCTVAG